MQLPMYMCQMGLAWYGLMLVKATVSVDFSQASFEATGIDVWSARYEARGHSADLLSFRRTLLADSHY